MLDFKYCFFIVIVILSSCKKDNEKTENNNIEFGPKIIKIGQLNIASEDTSYFIPQYAGDSLFGILTAYKNDTNQFYFFQTMVNGRKIIKGFESCDEEGNCFNGNNIFCTGSAIDSVQTIFYSPFGTLMQTYNYFYKPDKTLDSIVYNYVNVDDVVSYECFKNIVYDVNGIKESKNYRYEGEYFYNYKISYIYDNEVYDPKLVNVNTMNLNLYNNFSFVPVFGVSSWFLRQNFDGYLSKKLIKGITITFADGQEEKVEINYEKDVKGRISKRNVILNDNLNSSILFYYE